MAPHYGPNKTMAPENQFTFKCPVFHAPTRISACWEIRDRYATGERPPVRRGCQVAIECGKCPMTRLMWSMIRSREDRHHALDNKVRELDEELLQHIAPILIREEVMKRYELSPAEISKLRQANAEASTGVKVKRSKKTAEASIEEPASAPTPTTKAARSGDMAAALNEELRGE
jgi:hypothetical protein